MKRKVFKYRIEDKDTELRLPTGARILSAKAQGNTLVVYAEVVAEVGEGEEHPGMSVVHLYVMDTGEELPENIGEYTFLDSVFLSGTAVWCHVYYKQS